MLVHREPRSGIFPDNRLKLLAASLRHVPERSARGKFDPGMKNHAVTPARQRLAMDVDEWRTRALVQPHVSKGDAAFKPGRTTSNAPTNAKTMFAANEFC